MMHRVTQWLIQSLGSETSPTLFQISDVTKYEDLRGKWCRTTADNGDDAILLGTVGGVVRVDLGDWLAQGPFDEFYSIKPGVFEATYEPAR